MRDDGREDSSKGCKGFELAESPKLPRKDNVWQACSLDLVASSSDMKVWVVDLSISDLVRRLLASPDLGCWCGYPLALGQGVSSKHKRKGVKEKAWF